jgi:CHAD domain-containing protein
MTQYPADDAVVSEVETIRIALPTWIVSTAQLVELAENAERAAREPNPETVDRSRKLIVEVAEWQEKLGNWQHQALSPRLLAELRILKATLDASMDEANSAATKLELFN